MNNIVRIPVADRIERLPFSKYMTKILVLIALGAFWDAYMLFSVGPISAHFFSSAGQKQFSTLLPLALFLGTFVGAIGLSTLADKVGRRAAFTIDLCILAAGNLVAAFSSSGVVFLFGLFIAGVGTGAELPLTTTYVQEFAPARTRGRMSSAALTIGFLGGTVGGFSALILVPLNHLPIEGFRVALLLAALGGFSSLLLRRGLPESPRWLERVGRVAEADHIMDSIEREIISEKGLATLPAPKFGRLEPTVAAPSLRVLFSPLYIRRTASAWSIELLQGFGAYGFTTFVPLLLYSRGYSIIHALAFTAIIQISYPLGTLVSVWVTDKFQRKWAMACAYTLNLIFGLCFLYSRDAALVIVFGFLTEAMIFISGPLLHTYEAEIYPTVIRARGAGISFAFSRLGGFLAPLVASILVANGAGGEWLIAAAAAAWLSCALISAIVAIDTTNVSLETLESVGAPLNEVRMTDGEFAPRP